MVNISIVGNDLSFNDRPTDDLRLGLWRRRRGGTGGRRSSPLSLTFDAKTDEFSLPIRRW